MALRDVRLISVAAGGCFSVAISDAGSVYAWGEGGPRAGFEADVLLPRRLSLARPLSDADQIIAAMAGHTHVLLRTANGKLLTWGSGGDGKLGHGTSEDKATPHAVAPLADVDIIDAAGGMMSSLAIGRDGSVYGWGFASRGAPCNPGAPLRGSATPRAFDALRARTPSSRSTPTAQSSTAQSAAASASLGLDVPREAASVVIQLGVNYQPIGPFSSSTFGKRLESNASLPSNRHSAHRGATLGLSVVGCSGIGRR